MNQKVVIWIVIAIAVLVLVPLLGMLDMIGTGSMMSRGMGGMMMGWGLVWMVLLAALIIALIVLLVRTASRS